MDRTARAGTPAGGRRARARRRASVALVVPALVAAAATFGINELRANADRHRRAQVLLARVETYAHRQNVAESTVTGFGLVARRGPNATFERELVALPQAIAQLRDRARRALDELDAAMGGEGAPESVAAAFGRFQATLETQIRLLRAGDFDDAWIYDRERVDASFAELRDAAATADAALEARAEDAGRLADMGTLVLVALALLSIVLLRRRAERERRAFEARLEHQAFHDPLTNLANRLLLKERVEHALKRLARRRDPFAVLFLDLDGFKAINDGLGHEAGDELLVAVARRLLACTRASDTVARLGGDEFAVVLEDLGREDNALTVAARILADVYGPFDIAGRKVTVGVSLGVALADGAPITADELLANADVAMYAAKGGGKGRYEVYRPGMRTALLERLDLQTDLERALANDELDVHYQPIVDMASRAVTGVEALLRWNHPRRGSVPPLEFIALAEQTGLIHPIGQWVLERACEQGRRWQALRPHAPLRVCVNFSALQFQHPRLADDVAAVLERTGMDASQLVIEITEQTLMVDTEVATAQLTRLKSLGVGIAIDDFGTGYSSLNYLRRFPIDILKIDRSFVEGVAGGPEDSAFTEAIVRLARTLRVETVGEGIERPEQFDELRRLDCAMGQGYLFAHPAPARDVERMLRAAVPAPGAPAPARSTGAPRPVAAVRA
ncbi:MAG TPA: bifunctional diguanylate cyclase/phosphodiesterase [Actinomycetota bacterium]|nr:bifunctional diguanylate cyclase/phosphodiesterase [Actinomycetota bacterium]